MKALILFAGFVIASTAAAVLIGTFIERQTSPQVGTIVMLTMFFGGIVVSWIATVFFMDGSLKNFYAEQDQIEAERKGREYMNRSAGLEG
jgi:RsiW-degrading membrane proteinase PrsW (M82 family)